MARVLQQVHEHFLYFIFARERRRGRAVARLHFEPRRATEVVEPHDLAGRRREIHRLERQLLGVRWRAEPRERARDAVQPVDFRKNAL